MTAACLMELVQSVDGSFQVRIRCIQESHDDL